MHELTRRLATEQPIIMGGASPTVNELRDRTGKVGYVLVKFTESQGGVELAFPLDRDATDLSKANFDEGTGVAHIEGQLILNNDPVRCVADIALSTLRGTGRLELEEKAAAAEPARWQVVVNDEEQYSIWPDGRPVPPRWRSAGPAGAKSACLEHIAAAWTDMRPLSLRTAAAHPMTAGPEHGAGATADLAALILGQAERTPQATAVVCADAHVTYRELAERGCRLAHHLRAAGAAPDTIVAVALDRSLDQLVAAFAVLLAGAAYLPLDPSYPPQRLAKILEDSGAPMLVTRSDWLGTLAGKAAVTILTDLDDEEISGRPATAPEPLAGPGHLSYIIFTSGSTGRPKGAMNTRGALLNRLAWAQRAFGLTPRDTVLQKTPVGFDVSVWEIFWPLLAGARIVVARPEGHRDPRYLEEMICRHQVTLVHFVPPMLRGFLEGADLTRCGSLRQVLVGGESLTADLQRAFFDTCLRAELDNQYGPAEAAIDVTRWHCPRDWDGPAVPIGRPVDGAEIHLVDAAGHLVTDGGEGEVYIGGIQVGRGYLGQPAMTAERFVPDPFGATPGARLYRTGDRGRWRPDGALQFLGRVDDQVKLHGVRIEPGEIEAVLSAQPGVRACAVAVQGQGADAALVAYVVGGAAVQRLRGALAEVLPPTMIPTRYVQLDHLPLSVNGKLDRRRLPSQARLEADAASW
jgi:amino acid adenylation domain-containing protein